MIVGALVLIGVLGLGIAAYLSKRGATYGHVRVDVTFVPLTKPDDHGAAQPAAAAAPQAVIADEIAAPPAEDAPTVRDADALPPLRGAVEPIVRPESALEQAEAIARKIASETSEPEAAAPSVQSAAPQLDNDEPPTGNSYEDANGSDDVVEPEAIAPRVPLLSRIRSWFGRSKRHAHEDPDAILPDAAGVDSPQNSSHAKEDTEMPEPESVSSGLMPLDETPETAAAHTPADAAKPATNGAATAPDAQAKNAEQLDLIDTPLTTEEVNIAVHEALTVLDDDSVRGVTELYMENPEYRGLVVAALQNLRPVAERIIPLALAMVNNGEPEDRQVGALMLFDIDMADEAAACLGTHRDTDAFLTCAAVQKWGADEAKSWLEMRGLTGEPLESALADAKLLDEAMARARRPKTSAA